MLRFFLLIISSNRLQSEIVAQEERLECFHKRVSEIQALLESTEAPLELQVQHVVWDKI